MIWNKCKKVFFIDAVFCSFFLLLLIFSLLLLLISRLQYSPQSSLPHFEGMRVLRLFTASPINPFIQGLTSDISPLYGNTLAWLTKSSEAGSGGILTFTDPWATYSNPVVLQFWYLDLYIADSILGIFIVLAGYQIILGGYSSRYSQAIDALPKLIFGVVGANGSLIFARFFVDLNNLLCVLLVAQEPQQQPLNAFQQIALVLNMNGISLTLLAIVLVLFIALGIQMAVRTAMIIFLTIWLPVLFLLLTNGATRRFGQAGLTTYPVVCLTQMLQVSVLIIGTKVLLPFITGDLTLYSNATPAPLITLMVGVGLLWVTLRIPSLLRNWALQPVAESAGALKSLALAFLIR